MSVALVRNPGAGTLYRCYDTVQKQVVSDSETQGVVSVLRLTMRQDESWVVLSGRVRFWVGSASPDECDIHDAGPGAYVFGLRSVPHTFQPLSATADLLVINNSGQSKATSGRSALPAGVRTRTMRTCWPDTG
jgi:mannose-6-phosphate isomerase-like protein (cupin superfamily)